MRMRALAVIAFGSVVATAPSAYATSNEPPESAAIVDRAANGAAADPLEIPALAAARMTARLIESVSSSAAGRSFIWPVKGAINTPFGGDHDGIDIEGETGDPIAAARDGRITFAGDDGDGYGTKIVIAHGRGVKTLYSHLSRTIVEKGWVKRGTVIGEVGCTGSCSGDHLHFEIQRDGAPVDPLDVLP